MNHDDIVRVGGIVIIVAGLWTAAGALLSFVAIPGWVFFSGTVLTAFALHALYAVLAGPGGALELLAFEMASVGDLSFLNEAIWGDIGFAVAGGTFAP